MIRAITAQTSEIDEADLAVVNLLAQLELGQNLLRYSVGLVFCHMGSLDDGLIHALAQALPFPLTGISVPLTSSQTDKSGFSLLTLTVLTSNDVVFSVGLSEPLTGDDGTLAKRLGEVTSAGHGGQRPKLGLLFGPANKLGRQADLIIDQLSSALPGCPLFGGLCGDFTVDTTLPGIIFGGDSYPDSYSLVLLYGLVRPRFDIITIPERRALKRRAFISKSEGNIISEVNGIPITDYLIKMGVLQQDKLLPIQAPFLVTDSAARTRIMMLERIESDSRAVFSRQIPPNSTLGLAGFDETDVMRTAKELTEALKWERFDFCLISNCLTRNIMLGLNYLAEFNQFKADLGLQPYVAFYGGGEICPVLEDDEETVNRFHNLALASCRF